jgi:hypothetical protein
MKRSRLKGKYGQLETRAALAISVALWLAGCAFMDQLSEVNPDSWPPARSIGPGFRPSIAIVSTWDRDTIPLPAEQLATTSSMSRRNSPILPCAIIPRPVRRGRRHTQRRLPDRTPMMPISKLIGRDSARLWSCSPPAAIGNHLAKARYTLIQSKADLLTASAAVAYAAGAVQTTQSR